MSQPKGQQTAPVHEWLSVGILLAVVGGFLDAYTYIFRGGVFANAQTGNIVLMSVFAANGEFKKAAYYLIPITAFFVGILVVEFIKRKFSSPRRIGWESLILSAEILLLFFIGLLPAGAPNAVANVTVSFLCSMQVHSFRLVRGAPYATTMCTGNLRSAAECFFRFAVEKDSSAGGRFLRYAAVILSFCAGAVAGALLTALWQACAVWVCCLPLGAVLVMIRLFKAK